ncbi:hypothetical protein BDV93DRAFT_317861 [Ceratobasidium sp. AG-I]|nr:hypothetical protein BDV93DRAFT_317861 [Ceratobasidium sp. AG-I]
MASLTMTPLDAPRPSKRFRRSTTGETPSTRSSYAGDLQTQQQQQQLQRARPYRSASTSSYPHPSRRTTTGSNSLTHSLSCSLSHSHSLAHPHSHSHSRTSSFSHGSPFAHPRWSRSRSAAEARAFVLDPAYSGVEHSQARVFVDERGVAHDPDYRMFPVVPPSPSRSSRARRGSMTSMRGGRSSEGGSPFAGSVFAGCVDFTARCSFSVEQEEESDEEEGMEVDDDAESVIEWSRLHAAASPLGYGTSENSTQGGLEKVEDGYADFVGMEWDEKEWRREEVTPAPESSSPSSAASAKDRHTQGQIQVPNPASASASTSGRIYPKPKRSTKSKTESVSSVAARGYMPAKRSYAESIQDEWTPSCGHSVRRHWQSFTLRIRLSVFRWRRRLRRALGTASSSSSTTNDR